MFYRIKKFLRSKKGLTLMETLIVISLLAIIAAILLFLLDPKAQIEKAWDAKRKKDLDSLAKIFEEYYNDKGCYPKPTEVCYTGTTPFPEYGILGCKICRNNFSPYREELPCDPQSPSYDYLYTVDNENCPGEFVIYAHTSREDDPQSQEIPCTNNTCGPAGEYGYAENSPNGDIITRVCDDYAALFCYDYGGVCNQCKTGESDNCTESGCNINRGIFTDFTCQTPCIKTTN